MSSVGAARRKSRACWAASAPSVRGRDVGRQRRCPPERRQGAIRRERALRFEWMGLLRAFIAGVVLALGLARVSPSGKARASQARMRGFESRHPLQKKFKAGLQSRTAPHRWRFIRRPAFLMSASRFCQLTWDIGKSTSSLVCISLSQDLPWCGNPTITKAKISAFCNFFAIADVVVPGSYMALPFRYEKAFQGEGSS